jgi:hypothetical protein
LNPEQVFLRVEACCESRLCVEPPRSGAKAGRSAIGVSLPLDAAAANEEDRPKAVPLDGAAYERGQMKSGRTSRTSRGLARSCNDREQSA